MSTYVNLNPEKYKEKMDVMKQIAEAGVCPFCPEHLSKYHKNPILKESKHWLLTKNQWPYENLNAHFLAIHKTHIEHIKELEPDAGQELFELFAWAAKEFNIPGGAVTMRFGSSPDGNYGSSVLHLHAHLMEPDLKNPAGEKIKFKIGHPNSYKKS